MDPTSFTNMANLLLSITDKFLDKLPDYDQSKKEQFYRTKKAYERAISYQYPYRDDNQIDVLREDLIRFVDAFNQEISK